jgi:hypothetical protein
MSVPVANRANPHGYIHTENEGTTRARVKHALFDALFARAHTGQPK